MKVNNKLGVVLLVGLTLLTTACKDEKTVNATQRNIENLWDGSRNVMVKNKSLQDIIYYHISSSGTWTVYDYMDDAYDGRANPKNDRIKGDSRDCYVVRRLFNTTDKGSGNFTVYDVSTPEYSIKAEIDNESRIMRITTPKKIYKHPLPKDQQGKVTDVQLIKLKHIKFNYLNACDLM